MDAFEAMMELRAMVGSGWPLQDRHREAIEAVEAGLDRLTAELAATRERAAAAEGECERACAGEAWAVYQRDRLLSLAVYQDSGGMWWAFQGGSKEDEGDCASEFNTVWLLAEDQADAEAKAMTAAGITPAAPPAGRAVASEEGGGE